jgi:DNA-binding transcriptional MerR regulator
MSEAASELSIGDVAARTGLSVHALRFYERAGLLANPVRRGTGGRRVYTEDDLDWLDMCIRFRESGMPITAIREYADLVRQGTGNETGRLAILRQHQERVAAQIAQLTACLDIINYKVSVYEEHLAGGTAGELWTAPVPDGDDPGQAASADQAPRT